jgi:hypothetical protein
MIRWTIVFLLFMLMLAGFTYPAQDLTAKTAPEQLSTSPSTPGQDEGPPGAETEAAERLYADEPVVTYLIEAQLFPHTRKLTGVETLTWKNTSRQPVDHLQFHLYYNAFRSLATTFMQEGQYYKRYPSLENPPELKFGEIKIKEIHLIGGGDLTENLRFISPEDGNPEDRTVMELKLPNPVPSGQILRLKLEFILTIPQIFARTGAEGDYFFMGQWFPKIGVLLENGQWHCWQFHYNSGFYSDYGTYRVWLTVPGEFLVGATGNLSKTEKNADNSITYVFEEKNIHDFAWAASPDFTRVTETVQLKDRPGPTVIELLLSPGHDAAKERYLNAMKFALHFYAKTIFPFPYKKITVVDPPLKGLNSAGMEYPGLITAFYTGLLPQALKLTEAITIHGVGHQYWYGIVGTDETREAWLDEGVNTFFELEIMDDYFKNSYSLLDSPLIKINDWEATRLLYTHRPPLDPVNYDSWRFLNCPHHEANAYAKAAIFLRSLKNLVGKERMLNFFKYYAEKYQFKHPTTEDFIDTFNTFMNEDFSWAFDQFIKAETGLDHAVYSVESVKIAEKPDMYRNEAIFIRTAGYFPVELVIGLENQKEIRSFWKEKAKWKKIVFTDPSPIKYAAIDPLYKVPLDRSFLDNTRVCKPAATGIKRLSLRIGFFFQNLLGFLTF